jgi:hypothetical protein
MPSAYALGLGDVRLRLTRLICAFCGLVLSNGGFLFLSPVLSRRS